MKDVQFMILRKENFNGFISQLAKTQKVMAPVAKGNKSFVFEEVTSGDQISLKYIPTVLPPKKFFMPQREPLVEFDQAKGLEMQAIVEQEKMVLFGVHTCDLAGIQCLNMVFSERPKDYNYLTRKYKINIIGLGCNEYCDEHASCNLVNANVPNGGYDLFFSDVGDYFIVHINTHAGDEIIEQTKFFEPIAKENMQDLVNLREKKKNIFKNEIPIESRDIAELFDKSFESPVWEEVGERCLSCGNCTNVCPTCYCFDIIDEVNLDLKSGKRYRKWYSCQLDPFALVAGGENFRKSRAARQKHRYYRKFKYPVSKFSRFFCTGCGRCTRTCMAGISLKETLNNLIKERVNKLWIKWL
ncbi:MAG: 4Fe-4S dicluster domain-containing protein [Nitrospiraceae bacterium]|nr:4Fe-4S dicluster domain-containing protein [Nitrospiraceae bacterium]